MKYNALVPEFAVRDLAASLRFYVDGVGFKLEYQRPEQGFVFLSFEGSQLMLETLAQAPAQPLGLGMHLQLVTADVPALHQRLVAAGYPIESPPTDRWRRVKDEELGDREILVRDPDGYLLRFMQGLGSRALGT